MKILVINCSPQQLASSTYSVAQAMIDQLTDLHELNIDMLDATGLPHIDSDYANSLCAADNAHDLNKGSLAISDRLICSLERADLVIIASPMHNYSVPSCLKSWLDHVVRAGKTFNITATGKQALLADKPVYVLVSSGGVFSGEAAYQPDFFTPYIQAILATIGLNSVLFFTIEGTANRTDLVQQKIADVQRRVCEHLATALA
ncbi:FMN-dependent NADH-azoreductase [Shewanella baltica]|uniref:FMN-dependent NADH-azoreductase n=1 Tax=Shewanella baltica TaxID=62322 RepID=UPI003218430E